MIYKTIKCIDQCSHTEVDPDTVLDTQDMRHSSLFSVPQWGNCTYSFSISVYKIHSVNFPIVLGFREWNSWKIEIGRTFFLRILHLWSMLTLCYLHSWNSMLFVFLHHSVSSLYNLNHSWAHYKSLHGSLDDV